VSKASADLDSLVARACSFHPWDAMAPQALSAIVSRGPFESTAETGCGGSTIVLSHLSRRHLAFAIEGESASITGLRSSADLQAEAVTFVEGQTKDTAPGFQFGSPLDLVLLDGPHAYPLPQLEYAYFFPKIKSGGWLVLDDLQIRSVYELFSFLRHEASVVLEEVVVRTAFFRKVDGRPADRSPDGWWLQGINQRPIWRYAWRDRLRKALRGSKESQNRPKGI
jgi:hypothetical protein